MQKQVQSVKELKEGKEYIWEQIESLRRAKGTEWNDYGREALEQNIIHVSDGYVNAWLLLVSSNAKMEWTYKCVFHN